MLCCFIPMFIKEIKAVFVLQFGMLIEYLFEKFPDTESVTETAIGDLQVSSVALHHMAFLCTYYCIIQSICEELYQFNSIFICHLTDVLQKIKD